MIFPNKSSHDCSLKLDQYIQEYTKYASYCLANHVSKVIDKCSNTGDICTSVPPRFVITEKLYSSGCNKYFMDCFAYFEYIV